jgi:hypothetical protein
MELKKYILLGCDVIYSGRTDVEEEQTPSFFRAED